MQLALLLQSSNDGATDWPAAMIAVGGIAMITIIAAVAIWQGLVSWRARMSIAREDAYRKLAEENLSAQTRMAVQQQRIADDLAELKGRVVDIERILKEVG